MIRTENADVLVIGSGGAGLRTAIELHDHGADVLVVGKSKKRDAHTILATGGINAALGNMDPKDSWRLHAADTIKEGWFINNPIAVKTLCKNAPLAIKELLKWGVKFNKKKNGQVLQRFFGAATYRRACFSGDYTGREIQNTLVDQVEKRKIKFKSEVYIFSLLKSRGKVNGALGLDVRTGKIIGFNSKIVVLATGGHSRMFSRSSSRIWENNGDGIALAHFLGADFMDMEMFQFHPTGMVYPRKAEGVLVTEAVRGEGGVLLNSRGERFMKKYAPDSMELSARDVVARAVYNEVHAGRGTKRRGVWLDISHRPKKYILERIPRMYRQFQRYLNLDISKKKMEVAPTAHYSMGGILTNHENGKTSVKNLFAVGEVTAAVHGANRLGGNSLAEIMVFGRLTGISILKELKKLKLMPINQQDLLKKISHLEKLIDVKKGKNPLQIKKDIQELMWKNVGVVRDAKKMKNALKQINKFKKIALKVPKKLNSNEKLLAALDIQNMLPTCEMIVKSALMRKESRGAHYRTDYKKTLPKWKKNIKCTPTKTGFKLSLKNVPRIPKDIQKFFRYNKPSLELFE